MSIRNYFDESTKDEIIIKLNVKDINDINLWLTQVKKYLKYKNIKKVMFCAKIEFYESTDN